MKMMISWILSISGIFILTNVVSPLPLHYFFNPILEDESWRPNEKIFLTSEGKYFWKFNLDEPVIVNKRPYFKIFIWSDGFVTFKKPLLQFTARYYATTEQEMQNFVNVQMRPPLIAVLMGQLDFSMSGARVRVRNILRGSTVCRDLKLFARIEQEIRILYDISFNAFLPKQITAITWDQVKLKNSKMLPMSFELAMVTDGVQTFVIFNYNTSTQLQNFVTAGIFPRSNLGEQYKLSSFFATATNAALDGMWIAKVTDLSESILIQPTTDATLEDLPRIRAAQGFEKSGFTACQKKDNSCDTCHSNSVCESQIQGGSCCRCKIGFTAVGLTCIQEPLQISYEGEININGKRLTLQIDYNTTEQLVQLQIYGNEAERYTPFFSALYGFLTGNGFLFAEQFENDRLNIYTLSNGAFDRNVELYLNGHQISVSQKGYIPSKLKAGVYKGKINTKISGIISSLIGEKKVVLKNYGRSQSVFKFSKTTSGQMEMQSKNNKIIGEFQDEYGLITNLTLLWSDSYIFDKACPFESNKMDKHAAFNIRNYEVQNKSSLTVRMRVDVFHSVLNPCFRASQVCSDPMSVCEIVSFNKYECRCVYGYILIDGVCSLEGNLCNGKLCGMNSVCQQTNTTFTKKLDCICQAGYKGDGNIGCTPDPRDCRVIPCTGERQCIYNNQVGKFRCTENFNEGSGLNDAVSLCNSQTCHRNAVCKHNLYCECKPGYIGDGENTCLKVKIMNGTCASVFDCGRISLCENGMCKCPNGTIDASNEAEGTFGIKCLQCNIDGNRARCHANADCVDSNDGVMICKCRQGFLGNGFNCVNGCSVDTDCAANATCVYSQCICQNGYYGNPLLGERGCSLPVRRCSSDLDCGVNAKCISKGCVCVRGFSGDPRPQGIGCRMEKCSSLYDCAENADCLNGKCACNVGYSGDARLYGIGGCQPTKCISDTDCALNARCRSSNCSCLSGFYGDGKPGGSGCFRHLCVDNYDCAQNAACVNKTCVCAPGFIGNAMVGSEGCSPGCLNAKNCAKNAICKNRKCVCPKGFEGNPNFDQDGCRVSKTCLMDSDCASNAQCQNGNCSCVQGYLGNPLIGGCTLQVGGAKAIKSKSCATNADCGPMATCKISSPNRCVCKEEFESDGVNCKRKVMNMCETNSDCHRNASCLQEAGGGRVCRCNKGFSGNGISTCLSNDDCNIDADCQQPNFRCTQGKCRCGSACNFCIDDNQCHPLARCVRRNKIKQKKLDRYCECPEGYFGDGIYRCDRCETDKDCQMNAHCTDSKGRRSKDCVCNHGYLDNGQRECEIQPFVVQTETAAEMKYENQSVVLKCKVISGPAIAIDLLWTTSNEEPINLFASNRAKVSIEENQRILTLSKLKTSDSGMYHCSISERNDESIASVNLTVLKNPCPICHSLAHCNFTRGLCQCNRGYKGNGLSHCVETNCATDRTLCTPEQNCRFNRQLQKFSCICKDGFLSQGDRCLRPNRPDFCLNDAECHAEAFCARRSGERKCKCKQGFEGDGKMECLPISINCRFNNKCHQYASCKLIHNDFQCVCNSGYIGVGDVDCQIQVNCNQLMVCGSFAKCVARNVTHRNQDGTIQNVTQGRCICNDGYTLVENACYDNEYLNTDVFVAYGTYILRIPVVPSLTKKSHVFLSDSLFHKNNETKDRNSFYSSSIITAVAADCSTGNIYWASYDRNIIFRTSSILREENSQQNEKNWLKIAENITGIEGLAFDWKTGNLFYASSYVDSSGEDIGEIGIVNRIGNKNYRKVLLKGEINDVRKPREIVLDSAKGIIVWTDWDRKSPRIMQANMDGSNTVVLLRNLRELPNGLTIGKSGEICYAAASEMLCKKSNCTIFNHSRIRCISTNNIKVGKKISTMFYSKSGQPYALASYKSLFFWTNWQDPKLYSMNRENKVLKTYASPILNNSRMYGLAILPQNCPNSDEKANACAIDRNYGNCKYICLPTHSGSRSCVCPDNLTRCFPDKNIKKRLMY